MTRLRLLATLIPLLLLAACDRPANDPAPAAQTPPPVAPTPPPPPPATPPPPMSTAALSAQVTLQPTQGNTATGSLVLSAENGGVHITGRLSGLTAGAEHGFHVHETGDCSAPDGNSAGAHFNPAAQPHGAMESAVHHAGDIPNQRSDAGGEAQVDVQVAGLELGSGGANDVVGRALIVHAQPDDYSTQPSGNAGARIACGVITRVP